MKRLKICVYAICKNESRFVDSWVDSMQEADLIVVTDTGSTDDTVAKLRERGVIVYLEKISPWRFDIARNLSLEHVPDDVDICVCTDLDELFEAGWREKLETAWQAHQPIHNSPIAKSGRYLYNWSLKADGSPDVQFYYFKIHDRHGFKWRCPVHEYVQYTGTLPLEYVFMENLILNHYPDASKSRNSYLSLLELAVEEAPEDERMRYYLGREYMYKGEWNKSIQTLQSHLSMPTAQWKEERCASMRWIAKSYQNLNQHQQAYIWYYKAIAEMPSMRDPYIEFAKLCFELKDWRMTYFLVKEALKIKEKSKSYVNMGYSWDYTPDDLAAISAYNLKLYAESLIHAENALRFFPEDERLQSNLKIIKGVQNKV